MNRRTRPLKAAIALVALLASGCSSWPVVARARAALGLGAGSRAGLTQEDLRLDLLAYAARFRATVIASSDQITEESADLETRRRALLWKIRILPLVDQAAFVDDVELSYVGLFAISVAQHFYLTGGAGKDLFGPQQPIAVDASTELVEAAERIGQRFLPEEDRLRLTQQVEALARERPIRGVFVPETVQAVVNATQPGGSFDWVMTFPLAPFRALEGVDSGAQAIRAFNVTAQQFNQVLADLPQRMRWHTELLTLELEQRPTVRSARASLEELAASSSSFSRAVETLPQNVREQAAALIGEVESSQGALQKTIAESRALLGDASGAVERFTPLASALERTAAQAQQAGVAWAALVAEVQKPGPPRAAGEEQRPFDVREYERTATEISSAAGELRRLLADLRALDPLLDRVEGGGRSFVNLAAWRVFELMLVFFGLLFLYRRIETRLAARGPGAETQG